MKSTLNIFAFMLLFLPFFGYSQKEYTAIEVSDAITLDGVLKEEFWSKADVADNFVQNYPLFNGSTEFTSKCYLVYTNDALYIAGEFYDPNPDSVSYTLSQRDDTGNADYVAFTLDTYGKRQNAFIFIVTAAGVEVDGMMTGDNFDKQWNAVWKSAVQKRSFGWSFEARIPFSAIRFPKENIQNWNINFNRSVRRTREVSFWNPVDPQKFGELQQAGVCKGVKGINPPLRLSFTPYLTGYVEKFGEDNPSSRINGGMDVKFGISEAFTLDMTLIPDFGQTRSDNQVLNLTPFEVRFNENRQFFTEGTDLFNFGGIFYSRRIGGKPLNYWDAFDNIDSNENVVNAPAQSQLLNATKVSGRTKGGLGIGLFNAVEGRSYATIENTTDLSTREVEINPYTNYNVFALSQNLKNNSSVSFVNTNVVREGSNRDANVSALGGTLFSKDRNYSSFVGLRMSNVFEGDEHLFGHTAYASVSKVQGKWQYGASYYEESDTYDPNDLGFLQNNNSREYATYLNWTGFKPKGRFLRRWANLNLEYNTLYYPNLFDQAVISGSYRGTFRNFLTAGVRAFSAPFGQMNHFESRTFGKPVFFEPVYGVGGFYSSDYSKKYALDMDGGFNSFVGSDRYEWDFSLSPRVRFSDQLFLVLRTKFEHKDQDFGYVSVDHEDYADKIMFGTRDRQVVVNSISGQYLFTNRMGIDLQFRHYWQKVDYLNFKELQEDASRTLSTYSGLDNEGNSLHNLTFNAFTIDLNYRWVFLPGSELRVVYKNNIFSTKESLDKTYFTSYNYLFNESQLNSISLKFLIFVDALYFKRR